MFLKLDPLRSGELRSKGMQTALNELSNHDALFCRHSQGPRICASSGCISRARQNEASPSFVAANGTKISGCSEALIYPSPPRSSF